MQKAIFLDRDGTINVEKNYLYKKEDFEFLPRVIDGLKLLQKAGFLLVVVTNQSGIARGYYTEEDFYNLNYWMTDILSEHGINLTKVYYCPHLPDAPNVRYRVDCSCRKPRLGMFERAVEEFDINLNSSYTIGDKIRDCAICEKTGCKGFLIGQNENAKVIEQVRSNQLKNVQYAIDLYECAQAIIKQESEKSQ